MNIRVLGCSGSIARSCRTTSFLVDDDILIDAGTGVGDLELAEMARIDHILLTHSHLDHVLAVPLLADSVMRRRPGRPPIHIHGLPQTLEVLRQHLFNDKLWPDFTRLPTPQRPILRLSPLKLGQVLTLGAAQRPIEVLPAHHNVPAVGYGVRGPHSTWVFTGDTGPNPALWEALRGQRVSHLVIEIAFPETERQVAADSLHHCPSSLAAELRHVGPGTQVLLTHIKPGEMDSILPDLARRLPGVSFQALHAGDLIQVKPIAE